MDTPNPPGVDSNIGGLLLTLLWSLAGLSACILGLRLYTGALILHRLKLSDYLMIMAFACAIIQTSFLTASVHWGLGRHTSFLSDDELLNSMKFVILCQGWGIASVSFGRISFCLYLLQFIGSSRTRKWLLYFFVGTQVLFNALTIILLYAQCGNHAEALWNPNLGVKCWSPLVQRDFGFFQSAWNSLTDLFLTILPATIVWNLNLGRMQKLGVFMLLGLSLFAFIESVIKCDMIKELGPGVDITWRLAVFSLWAVSENYIVIIGASIPTLSPLWRRGMRNASDLRSYEMYGNNDSRGRTVNIVGQSRSASNVQKTVANTNSTSRGYSSTSQEHILESEIVRTTVVDVSYSDPGKLDIV
ncbi:hypothetical protein BDZ45DRAFT_628217 [Acephala macrosclerotiorum]|nr:hypothetical protein BDZ45DRAFT_628217 [Acephala macrosclerotiorum]